VDVEPETLDALVPSMVLQPLVENSIRHGFGTHLNTERLPSKLAVRCRMADSESD
jgi:LytS/YehU family sensor histidine kinase